MEIRKLTDFLDQLNSREFYFGPMGFQLVESKHLSESQIGYSVTPDGEDLTGEDEGDWKRNWMVCGQDLELGDPIFTDTTAASFPVFTAMHGAGDWRPQKISESIEGYVSALKAVADSSRQTSQLYSPSPENEIPEETRDILLQRVIVMTGSDCSKYWESLFGIYEEWLDESA